MGEVHCWMCGAKVDTNVVTKTPHPDVTRSVEVLAVHNEPEGLKLQCPASGLAMPGTGRG